MKKNKEMNGDVPWGKFVIANQGLLHLLKKKPAYKVHEEFLQRVIAEVIEGNLDDSLTDYMSLLHQINFRLILRCNDIRKFKHKLNLIDNSLRNGLSHSRHAEQIRSILADKIESF